MNKKIMIFVAFGVAVFFALVVIAVSVFFLLRAVNNLPEEIISFGRYDNIFYIGENKFHVYRDGRWGIRDARGNYIVEFGAYGYFVDRNLFDGGYIIACSGGTFHVLNPDGKEIAAFDDYDSVWFAMPNRFIVTTGSQVGVANRRNREVISMGTYTNIWASGERYIVADGNRVGALNARGREIIPLGRFDEITLFANEFIVRDGSSRSILDARGREVASLPSEVIFYTDDILMLTQNGEYAIYDSRGREIVPFGVYGGIYFDNAHFVVLDGNRWDSQRGVIDARGNEIIPMGRYDEIRVASENRFVVVAFGENWGGSFGVIDARGNFIVPMDKYDAIDVTAQFSDDALRVTLDGLVGAIDFSGKEIIPLGKFEAILSVNNNLAIVRDHGGRLGVVNIRRL
jgi:hypothetical protein